MPTFVYDRASDRMVDKETGEPMVSGEWAPSTPRVFGDIEPYLSPVSGEYVGGKRAKRADLDKHDCVDARELNNKPKALKNARFAKKRGLEHLLER